MHKHMRQEFDRLEWMMSFIVTPIMGYLVGWLVNDQALASLLLGFLDLCHQNAVDI